MIYNKLVIVCFISSIASKFSLIQAISVPNELLTGILKFDAVQFVPFNIFDQKVSFL